MIYLIQQTLRKTIDNTTQELSMSVTTITNQHTLHQENDYPTRSNVTTHNYNKTKGNMIMQLINECFCS